MIRAYNHSRIVLDYRKLDGTTRVIVYPASHTNDALEMVFNDCHRHVIDERTAVDAMGAIMSVLDQGKPKPKRSVWSAILMWVAGECSMGGSGKRGG